MEHNFIIYGSYGYSGNLIAEHACEQGLRPVLAGRNEAKLSAQAKRLGLEYRVFDLDNIETIQENIKEFSAILHTAGPFIDTYQNVVKACMATHTHYMDITGEYKVIEKLTEMDKQAKDAGIMLLPSCGFDVVPSDCLAQYLKSQLPDATQLTLAIHFESIPNSARLSRGTARSMARRLSEDSMIREGGILKNVPLAWKTRSFNFGKHKSTTCMTIAWGDLSSAWWSTHIPHVETYMSTSDKMVVIFRLINFLKSIFKWTPLRRYIEKRIERMPEGPSDEALHNASSYIYGEVKNNVGDMKAALLDLPNGYALTARSAILIIKKVLNEQAPLGFQTPSTAYGEELILEIPSVTRTDIFI